MNYLKKTSALAVSIIFLVCASFLQAAEKERPARLDAVVLVAQATVASIDHKTREVVLKDTESGETLSITAGEEVQNLDQVHVGDTVAVEYLEMVAMEVLPPGEVDTTAVAAAAKMASAPGQMPGEAVVQAASVVTVIDAIDKENHLVTLKGPEGDTKTVKARNPANLEKIAVGDKVLVTHTVAVAIKVVEK